MERFFVSRKSGLEFDQSYWKLFKKPNKILGKRVLKNLIIRESPAKSEGEPEPWEENEHGSHF